MERPEAEFAERVYAYVAQIPAGRVMTYGQLAALSGSPRAARIVGGVAHYGPESLPWHRVVNKQGGLASGYYGGRSEQARRLAEEGVEIDEQGNVDVERLLWWPPGEEPSQMGLGL
ncbi:MAG TPA: methylated-DNA--[protein]-cysteine S-methyltransferase [Candidatus Saccharimonas sp.]|nr:methylated-DNA--[protein]-cysteine S-methyltransferase [Candidatus Saccharimonas sp.]